MRVFALSAMLTLGSCSSTSQNAVVTINGCVVSQRTQEGGTVVVVDGRYRIRIEGERGGLSVVEGARNSVRIGDARLEIDGPHSGHDKELRVLIGETQYVLPPESEWLLHRDRMMTRE